MKPEKSNPSLPISADILGLSDVVVEDIKIDLSARKIHIFVKSTKEEIRLYASLRGIVKIMVIEGRIVGAR